MFDELSSLLSKLPVRSVWVVGGDFNAEVGSRGVGEEEVLGRFSHGRRTRSGPPTDGMGPRRGSTFCVVFYSTGMSGYVVSPQERGRASHRSYVD